MSVRVSGKHMEIGESFMTRIEDQVTGAVRKYYDGGFSSHVIVEKSGSRFTG
jgi:ribosome-associated translation inhibitor RaiA